MNWAGGGINDNPIDIWMSDILHRYGMLHPELTRTLKHFAKTNRLTKLVVFQFLLFTV
ncbi:MAG: hypothetical protein HXX20_12070 [Chloroflexi bacterium]|nr:hypothetical protein [Chloroflexota bacterium]